MLGDLVGDQSRTRQLDHGADRVVEFLAGGGQFVLHRAVDDLALGDDLGLQAHQRDHDLHTHGLTLAVQHGQRGTNDRAGLHLGDLRVEHRQPAAAGAQHRVLLVQLLHLSQRGPLLGQRLGVATGKLQLLDLERLVEVVRQELVQRRVEQPDGDRQALHRGEDALEVGLLHRQDLLQGGRALLGVLGEDHLAHRRQPIGGHEHVLGAAQADTLGTQLTSLGRILEVVGIGAHAHRPHLVGPGDDPLEVLVDARRDQLEGLAEDLTGRAVQGDDIALVEDVIADGQLLAFDVDLDRGRTGHTRLAEAAGDNRRVAGHAAVGGQHTLGHQHAMDVVRSGLVANQDDSLALLALLGRGIGIEDEPTDGGTRRGGQALGDRLGGVRRIDRRVQQLIELSGLDAPQRLGLVDDALVHQVGGDLQRSGSGALAVAGLQHVQLAVLDGELEILHVLVMAFKPSHGVEQLVVGLGQHLFHLGKMPRGADTRDDILALRVGQELAVDPLLAGGWVASEADAGSRGLATVAEDHLHDVDGGAQVTGDVVGLAVDLRAGVAPAAEDRVDRTVELLDRVGGPSAAQCLVRDLLELGDEFLEVLGGEVGIALDTLLSLLGRQRIFVQMTRNTLDDLAVHLNEAAVAVPGEALVVGLGGNGRDGVVADAQVEDGVHHAGHRHHGARADRNQQRIVLATERAPGALLETLEPLGDLLAQAVGPLAVVVHRLHASRSRDGEAVGHGNAQPHHLRDAGAFTTEDGLHRRVALGNVVDKLLSHC